MVEPIPQNGNGYPENNGNGSNGHQKHAGGRPTKYKPEYCKKIIEYFNRVPYEDKLAKRITSKSGDVTEVFEEKPCDPPLFGAFAVEVCDVTSQVLLDWCKAFPEFEHSYKKAKELQTKIIVTNAMRDNYAQAFSIFTAKNIMDWHDRQEVLEIKFIYEFAQRITSTVNNLMPTKCPHCRKPLALRDEIIKQLEHICRTFDEAKSV